MGGHRCDPPVHRLEAVPPGVFYILFHIPREGGGYIDQLQIMASFSLFDGIHQIAGEVDHRLGGVDRRHDICPRGGIQSELLGDPGNFCG